MRTETTNHCDLSVLAAEIDADRRVGAMLGLLRAASRLSQSEVAARIGVNPEEWEDHESGLMPVPVTRVPVIARLFQMEPADLFRLLLQAAWASPRS